MWIDRQTLQFKLNRNLKKIVKKDKYKIEFVKPLDLLTPERFDIIAKYIYIKFRELNIASEFGKELYLKHIEVFNHFFENDESNKLGADSFINSFNFLIESVKNKGYDKNNIIPISQNTILDGAHRVATAIYFNCDSIPCVDLEIEKNIYDYNFLKNRGLNTIYLDYMAYEYAKLKSNVYLVFIWPSAYGKDKELKSVFEKYGKVVYRKDIYLTENGSINLIRKVYKKESWLGDKKDNYIGARNKAKWCFSKKGPLRIFLFESCKDLNEMKDEIRKLFKIEKHSVHINDTREELIELIGLLFNDNSIHWLNFAKQKEFNWFKTLFSHFREWIKKQNFPIENFCINGSGVLSVYGIRECRDLDFLYFGEKKDFNLNTKAVGCHNSESIFYDITIDDLIFNPKYHFWVDGLKFVSLNAAKKMKEKRYEEKDVKDVMLINYLLENKEPKITITEYFKKFINYSYWKGMLKFFLLKVRFNLKIFLQKIILNLKGG